MSEKERSSSFCSEMDYCFRAFQNSSSPNVVSVWNKQDMSEGFGGKWTFQWLECLWMSLNVFAVIFDWDTLGCLVVSKVRKNPTCQPLVPIAAAAARPHHLLSLATGASLKNVIGTDILRRQNSDSTEARTYHLEKLRREVQYSIYLACQTTTTGTWTKLNCRKKFQGSHFLILSPSLIQD